LPTRSRARTSKVCEPSASPEYVFGEEQAAKAAPSSAHAKLAAGSLEKAKDALVADVVPAGPESITVSGGVASTIQVIEAGVLPLQRGRPLLGAIGALSLLLGCLLLASPPSEQITLIWRLAIYGIVLGILRLIFSFRVAGRANA